MSSAIPKGALGSIVAPLRPFSELRSARPTAATHILGELRQAILSMALPPGSPLVEKDLTERFGVSRTPLREALIRLAEERLVDIFPQSGTFVGRIPVAALPEAVVIRKALESAAVDLATLRGDVQAFDALDRSIDRGEALAGVGDQDGFHAADEAFHEGLAAAAGHPGIWRVAQQAKTQIDRCRRLTLPAPGRMAQVVAEHRAIVAAMRAGDGGAARAALDLHLSALIPDVEQIRGRHPDYFV